MKAFPNPSLSNPSQLSLCTLNNDNEYGMDLRDYFAAKAMQALIASNDEGAGDRISDVPTYAYNIADAMMEARK